MRVTVFLDVMPWILINTDVSETPPLLIEVKLQTIEFCFRRLSIVAKSAYYRFPVRPSECISAAPAGRISMKFDIGHFSENLLRIPNLVKIGQKNIRFIVAGYIKSS
jgi:hypothetical protein